MVSTEITEMGREKTSINIDQELWREIRKTAIDLDMSATDFIEQAARKELARAKKEKNRK
jgi:hypothetical protein